MKIYFLVPLFFLLAFTCVSAQVEHADSLNRSFESNNEIFTVVEEAPFFPGGESAWLEFLGDNLQYPVIARESGVQGKVWASFVVDKFGKVSNIRIERGIGGGCDEEVLRVLKLMPRWNPGKINGKMVSSMFRLPINFKLN